VLSGRPQFVVIKLN